MEKYKIVPLGKSDDLSNKKFGRLYPLYKVNAWRKNTQWLCRCSCGKTTIAVAGNLKNGKHRSCGCGRAGDNAFRYKKKIKTNGYVLIRDWNHPRANKYNGRIREHTVVMEKILGRYLHPNEEVHHKNGLRHDNRRSNLELWVKSQPSGTRVLDLVRHSVRILKRYAPKRLT